MGLTTELKRCSFAQIEKARLAMQYRCAAEKCELLDIPESWQLKLENEYEQLQHTLQLWTERRQVWYEAKGKQLQDRLDDLGQLELLQIKDHYKEVQFQFKAQRRRWKKLIRNLATSMAEPA